MKTQTERMIEKILNEVKGFYTPESLKAFEGLLGDLQRAVILETQNEMEEAVSKLYQKTTKNL